MRNSDRKKYEAFYAAFGHQLKFSTVSAKADMREMVRDLLLFSVDADRQCTLQEYVDNMPEGQDRIYYVCADNLRTAMRMPQTEAVRRKGYEVLYLTDPVDEFVVRALDHQGEAFFQNVSKGDLGLFSEEEKAETAKAMEEEKELLEFMQETLKGQVVDVRFSTSLVSYPVCLTSEGQITLEMERYFRSVPGDDGSVRAARVLEINAKHPSIEKVREAYKNNRERCADMTKVLFGQASLIAGMPIDDPAEYTELVCSLF
jgi:molecular chaperone HtpG